MCGNHGCRAHKVRGTVGSPPRVREPLETPQTRRLHGRITPACAGTTPLDKSVAVLMRDHPRVCGNHPNSTFSAMIVWGSPPRVREPPHQVGRREGSKGITPACAGTTHKDRERKLIIQDHPRVCGNHAGSRFPVALPVGSPPRVREPLIGCRVPVSFRGITPACAGTTQSSEEIPTGIKDHPRVCGNHATGIRTVLIP